MTNLTIMTLETILKAASLPTLEAWVRDVEQTCGHDGITATEARRIVHVELAQRPSKRDLADHLAACTNEQLVSLAYGEHAGVVLDADIPAWLAEAAYDELDRRPMPSVALALA